MVTLATIADRDGRFCRYCGRTKYLTLEHLLPRSRGGTTRVENIGISCRRCNALKGPLTDREFLALRSDSEALTAAKHAMYALLRERGRINGRIRAFEREVLRSR